MSTACAKNAAPAVMITTLLSLHSPSAPLAHSPQSRQEEKIGKRQWGSALVSIQPHQTATVRGRLSAGLSDAMPRPTGSKCCHHAPVLTASRLSQEPKLQGRGLFSRQERGFRFSRMFACARCVLNDLGGANLGVMYPTPLRPSVRQCVRSLGG